MKIKLAIDARTMGSRPSGIGMYLYNFLKELAEYEEIEPVLITDVDISEQIVYFKNKGIAVYPMGQAIYQSGGVYKYFAHVQRVLNEVKPDLFWEVNNIIPVKLKGDFKTIVTIHDVLPMTHTWCYGNIYKWYFSSSMKKTLKQAAAVVYDSEFSRDSTRKFFKQAERLPDMLGYIIMKQLKEKPVTGDEDYFLYVGNMEMRKGVDILLAGYRRYRGNGGTKKLVLAGKMVDKDRLDQLICEASSQVGGITYHNYVDEEKKGKLYAQCSCFVFPSRAEGFGMPVLEAMEYGKPVITSDLGIFREIAGDAPTFFTLENVSDEIAADNLAKAMAEYDERVDASKYEEVLGRYDGEKLGRNLYDFFVKVVDKR